MNNFQKLIGLGALVGTMGCEQPLVHTPKKVTGTVLSESGNYMRFKSPMAILVPQIIKKDANYILSVKTDEGIYTFEVYEPFIKNPDIATQRPISALEQVIEIGTRVSFPIENRDKTQYFGNDKIGRLPSSYVEVIK